MNTTIDGIEITVGHPAVAPGQIEMRDYYVVTSPSLPDGITVAFYRTLIEWCMATNRPGVGSRIRRFRTSQEARNAAVKYVVNRAKEAL